MIEISCTKAIAAGGIERWSDHTSGAHQSEARAVAPKATTRTEDDTELDALPSSELSDSVTDQAPRPVKEYLEQLPEVQRTALVLRHVMGYSVGEIAELTDASPNTVKDRLLRGAKEMRKLIRRDVAIGVSAKGGSA
ncbi:MAG: sigma-70 family RNA polymerase sigma factor [Polyangiaceae bacterium]